MTRASFVQRRKTILNNLQSALPNGKAHKDKIIEALESVNTEPTRRGETLSIQEFGKLADALYPTFAK